MVLLRAAMEKHIKGTALDIHNNPAWKGKEGIHTKDPILEDIITGELSRYQDIEGYYAAVDIGTTTLSIAIYDHYGKYVGGCAERNAQGKLGSDVMMRLMHVSEGRQEILHALIRDQIYHDLSNLLTDVVDAEYTAADTDIINDEHIGDDADAVMAHLHKIAVVGNTVMCHLFLNKDTAGLRGTPFCTAYQGSCRIRGRDLGWFACPDVEITVLPGIAAHVGADAAAVLMAENLWQGDRVQLAVDLGTNAEILLNNRGNIWVCSAAAGPAFEGQGISCGCRGGAGAVSGVKLNRANGNILLDVVPDPLAGRLLPRGICGSGLVDLIAELLENNLLQPDGYMLSQTEAKERGISAVFAQRLEEEGGERRFLLYDPLADKMADADRKQTKCLFVTQQDIRNFQLAKSGIQTGIALLCQQNNLDVTQIEDCRVAGVFGAFLHPDHAKASGLLPDLPSDRIHFVGNAAGRGAAQALFDPEWIPDLEKRIREVHHLELAEQDDFQTIFLQNMALGKWKMNQ